MSVNGIQEYNHVPVIGWDLIQRDKLIWLKHLFHRVLISVCIDRCKATLPSICKKYIYWSKLF